MAKYCFGVDIGGTTVKIGLFTSEGEVIDKWEIPTVTEGNGEKILPDISESILKKIDEKNIEKSDVLGIGLAAPGPVDDEGNVHKAVNLGWGFMNISEKLEGLSGFPVKSGNDANVAALGEMWKGAGKGHSSMVVVTLGTGIGGGIIINGKILAGSTGAGGEIGHIHIEDNETDTCGCGNKGCFEQYGSATGIAKLAKKRLAKDDVPSILRDAKRVDAKAVFDAVKEKDAVAIEIAEQFGDYLGKGLAAIAGVVNPEVFVIGGGVSKAGEVIFDYITEPYKKYVFHGSADVKFVLAELGNDAGIFGSAKLILDEVNA